MAKNGIKEACSVWRRTGGCLRGDTCDGEENHQWINAAWHRSQISIRCQAPARGLKQAQWKARLERLTIGQLLTGDMGCSFLGPSLVFTSIHTQI